MVSQAKEEAEKIYIVTDTNHKKVNKGPSSKAVGFPVVMYGCESWTEES